MQNDIIIRKASTADIPNISQVLAESWRVAYQGIVDAAYLSQISDDRWVESLEGNLPSGQTEVLVACCGPQIIGAVLMQPSRMPQYPEDGEITAIYLHPNWLGKGVGQSLMDKALSHLREKGFAYVVLDVLRDNQKAKRFYLKNGFAFTGHTVELTLGTPAVCEVMRKRV